MGMPCLFSIEVEENLHGFLTFPIANITIQHNIIIQKQGVIPSGAKFIILQGLLNAYAYNTNSAWKRFWKDILHALPWLDHHCIMVYLNIIEDPIY